MPTHKKKPLDLPPELTRARTILDAEAEAIRALPLTAEFVHAIDILQRCKGKVITTGMGKVGIVALKVATTLSSTGTPACFLHPGEAAHGDLGLVTKDDVMITFSNSGKTREVIEMLDRAKALNSMPLIAITSHPRSPIARQSDVVLRIGAIKEPCSLGLTPSSSTTAMMALGDAPGPGVDGQKALYQGRLRQISPRRLSGPKGSQRGPPGEWSEVRRLRPTARNISSKNDTPQQHDQAPGSTVGAGHRKRDGSNPADVATPHLAAFHEHRADRGGSVQSADVIRPAPGGHSASLL